MPRGKKENFRQPTPDFEDLGKKVKIPQLPKKYRQRLWRTIKVRTEIRLPEETEHFMNMLCLHFGLSRNDLILHAINLLWSEVCTSVGTERIQLYEDKLEAVRLWRLENKENMTDEQKRRYEKAITTFNHQLAGARTRTGRLGKSWNYNAKKNVNQKKLAPVVVYETEDEAGKE